MRYLLLIPVSALALLFVAIHFISTRLAEATGIADSMQIPQVAESVREASRPTITRRFEGQFRKALVRRANQYRKIRGVTEPLQTDAEMQTALKRLMSRDGVLTQERLSALLEELNREFPNAHALAAQVEVRGSDRELGTALSNWDEAHSVDFDALSLHLFDSGSQRGGLMVLSRRLPDFSQARFDGNYRGPYHQQCPLCSASYATQLHHAEGAGYLACPSCQEVFAIVVGTPDGRLRHASEFFEGFAFPLLSARSDEYGTLLEVWRRVLEEVEYKLDEEVYHGALDVWKSPTETWEDHGGDCEDTSILLCDALISAGIEARVAVGVSETEQQAEGHAWVVAKIGNQQFLLESTGDPHLLRQPLRVDSEVEAYRPIYQFDREAVYVSRSSQPEPCEDYWTTSAWPKRVMELGRLASSAQFSP